jgi:hypothetical protein
MLDLIEKGSLGPGLEGAMKYAFLLMFMAVACASTTSSSGSKPDGSEIDPNAGTNLPPSEGPDESCVDSDNKPVQCDSDKDCCPGFYCGLDPEGSTRLKSCIYGGGAK